MQHVRATVRLSGDLNFTVEKPDITVAEVVLLRAIHGEDAVVNISPIYKSNESLRDERDRLLGAYGGNSEPVIKLIHQTFANVAVQGLEKLEHIGLTHSPAGGVMEYVPPTARRIKIKPAADGGMDILEPDGADEPTPPDGATPLEDAPDVADGDADPTDNMTIEEMQAAAIAEREAAIAAGTALVVSPEARGAAMAKSLIDVRRRR